MANVEIIGLLCAGSTGYHTGARSSGGGDRLTRAELAGLLAHLDKPAMNLALAKYALDLDAERLLITHVRVWLAGVAVEQAWHIVKGRPTVVNMAALAVFEVVRPNRCPRCQGRGVVSNKACSVCDGSGFKFLSGRKMADVMGVDEAAYRRLWRDRYHNCLKHVQDIDSKINKTLAFADRKMGC